LPVTIRDVAKHAGVTIGTVSRAINGYKDIKPATKEKIFKSIKELRYAPTVIARGLSSKVGSNIGVIVSGLLDSHPHDNLWYMMLQGIYRFSSENNLEVAVYATDSNQQIKKSYTQFCYERKISGAIVSGITTTDAYFKELIDTDIPCVVMDVPVVGNKVGCVSIDNVQAASEMTKYLMDMGHRNCCVIAGKKNATVTYERLKGIQSCMEAHGIELTNDKILYCDFSQKMAYDMTKQYVEKHHKNAATAFICMSDIMAMGAMEAIKECGYRIPDDFSITGFDGIPVSEYMQPPLTTIQQDIILNGYQGALLLRKIINDPTKAKHVYIPYKIVIRGSVKSI